ncbi:GBS Bsp-like repeat-containing protein [Streptococcus pluranimalium]|uniref:GBS Bsp-like repeat-containing protein n=1 Tax=Streptococcus pluranimalium TaxID=82348 RepID=UPI00292E49B6|nr:GBS Bsp-like repeat-containing protein [Streptococcus pluranimalium]
MKKKMYKSKKHWVIAGITSAGLILSPSVLAEESANHTTSSSVSSWVGLNQPAQLAPTSPDTAPASSETDSRVTSEPTLASTDLSVNKTQSESPASSVRSSEATPEESFAAASEQSSSSVRSASAPATHVESVTDPTVSRTTSSPESASALTSTAVSSSDGDLPGAAAGNGHSEEVLVTKVVNHKTLTLKYNGPIASNEKIQYAVWGDVNGRNDITWYTADQIGAAYVDLSKHKEYGLYHVHTYKNSSGKMIGLEGGQLTVAKPWLTPKITESSPNHYVVRLEGVPSSISAVKVPVWSDKNGQDDLKWYSASQVSSGIYEAYIDTTYHNNDFGTYHVHAYGVSAITGQQIAIASTRFERVAKAVPQQSLAKVSISAKTDTTATVTVTAVEKAIKSIAVAAWSKTGGQDDLKWYQASAVNQTAQVMVNMRDLSNTSDDYTIHVYTTYQDGSRVGTNLGDHRFTRPAASQTVSARLTSTGIALSVASTAVKDLSKVRVAVWSDASGQDDIKWYATDAKGEALALYGNHRSTGLYHIHAYSYETGKPVFVAKTTTTIAQLPSKTGSVSISSVNHTTNTFQTTISQVSARDGLKSVRVAVWSDASGQDDLEWQVATRQSNGTYIATTSLAKHGYTNGKYHVHVYYELGNGSLSALSASTTTISGVVAKEDTTGSASQGNYGKVNKIIYLDAGHGGYDPGAVYGNITEKSLNLKIQSLVQAKLERAGYKVITTRTADSFVDLLPRSSKANQSLADLFVSIHFNASTSASANGIETYYYEYYPEYQPSINKLYHNHVERLKRSATLASAIQSATVGATGAKNNGVLRNTFAVLRETTAPAVLLELGYLSNDIERSRVTQSSYQEKLTNAIVSGILSYYKTYSI